MKIMTLLMAVTVCLAFMPAAGISQDSTMHNQRMKNDTMMQGQSIYQIASRQDSLSTFVKLVKKAGLKKVLNKKNGPYTVFAPTNAAFDALPKKKMKKLKKRLHRRKLRKVLRDHIVSGKVMSSDLHDGQSVMTMNGGHARITMQNNQTMIDSAKVVKADIKASNGVIHVINKVLMPSSDQMMKGNHRMRNDTMRNRKMMNDTMKSDTMRRDTTGQ